MDDPANEAPGWMVAKSGTSPDAAVGGVVVHQHFSVTDPAASAEVEAPAPAEAAALSVVGKIKALLTGKEDIEMTKEEMNAELDVRFDALSETLKSLIPASVEAPAEVATPEAAPEEPAVAAGVTADEVSKAVEDGLAPFLEVIDKTLDRIAGIESALAIRKSLDGQETRDDESADNKPTLNDAFTAALKGRKVELS